jgi:hypothetical protein
MQPNNETPPPVKTSVLLREDSDDGDHVARRRSICFKLMISSGAAGAFASGTDSGAMDDA